MCKEGISQEGNAMTREKILLKTTVMLTQLPIRVYDRQGKELEKYEIIERNEDEYECALIEEINRRLKTEDVVTMEYDMVLPVRIYGLRGEERNYLLGPFAYGSLESKEIKTYMRRRKIADFPRVQIRESLLAANLVLNGVAGRGGEIDLFEETHSDENEEIRMHSLVNEELRQSDNFQSNHTQDEENLLYQYIEQGDVEYLRKNYDYMYLRHPIILEDTHKNEEYMAVIGISLASRAAIRGGLTSKEGFLINDIYLKKLSACRTIAEIHDLLREASLYCAAQVRKRRQAGQCNPYVERCKKRILSNLQEMVGAGELAKETGLSMDYLSKLFKRYEGVSVTEYILNVKIEAACNMLKYSDRQIGAIADYLSFGSLSYFSRVFKKKTGMSPQQYRKNILR